MYCKFNRLCSTPMLTNFKNISGIRSVVNYTLELCAIKFSDQSVKTVSHVGKIALKNFLKHKLDLGIQLGN